MGPRDENDVIKNEMSNDDVVASLPKNGNGQVEIDENGWIKGLEPSSQPVSQPGAPAAPEVTPETPKEDTAA